jgi:hypothetical protein
MRARGHDARLPARRQCQRVPVSCIARWIGGYRHPGDRLFRASRKPALVFAQRPAAGRRRHRQPHHRAMRQSRAAADRRGARRHNTDCPRAAAALLGFVCSTPNSLDCRRRVQRGLRRHRVFSDFDAAAQGDRRSGYGCRFGLRPDRVGVCREPYLARASPGS